MTPAINKAQSKALILFTNDDLSFFNYNRRNRIFFCIRQANISQLVESEYKILNLTDSGPLDYTPEYKVPKNKFFFMGDNRDNSSDSRFMSGVGFVPKENII